MNSPSLSPGRQAYLLAVRRQKRQVRLWQPVLQWRKASAWPPPSSPFAAAATCGGT